MAVTISGSGQVPVQVIQTVKTDTFTTSSSSYVDVTGLSVTITPKSASNKILVLYSGLIATISGEYTVDMQLVRNSTAIFLGDAAGSRQQASSFMWTDPSSQYTTSPANGIYLDSPATTSATTYKLQMKSPYSQAVYLNRTEADGNNDKNSRSPAQIIVMEIAFS
jgi:hypothetical protein